MCRCAPNVAAPNVAGAVTPEFRVWSPKKRKKRKNRNSGFGPLNTGKGGKSGKNGKPEFRIWTLENRKRRKTRKAENTEKTENPFVRKTQQKERKMNSGMMSRIFGCNRNELRNKVLNCWHAGPETTENGKRNLKKRPVLTGHVWCGHVGGLRNMSIDATIPNYTRSPFRIKAPSGVSTAP